MLQEEESARKAAEEEARLAVEREQRKADRAARRAEAKRQGLLLTGKAKRDAERLAVQREQLLRNAGVDISGASPSAALVCMAAYAMLPVRQCVAVSALVHETCQGSDCPQCLQGAPAHAAGDVAGKAGPKKVVYGKKKNARKEAAPTDAASRAAEEEADALAERQATEEAANQAQASLLLHVPCLQPCQRGTAVAFAEDAVCSSSLVTPKLQTNIRVSLVQSDAQKAAEAERAQQVEAPPSADESTMEESEEDIDWENMDLDAVKLPGTKKEELPATEAVKRPPADEIRVGLCWCKQSWQHWTSASGVCISMPAVRAGSDQYLG